MTQRLYRLLNSPALLVGGLLTLHMSMMGIQQCGDVDNDGDGWTIAEGDCDDAQATTYPGATELCDQEDNDCDEEVDEGLELSWYLDQDADGYGAGDPYYACTQPAGYSALDGDCDDSSAAVHPEANDGCDGLDNDCDTEVDEEPDLIWYPDVDQDGYGGNAAHVYACTAPDGYISTGGDCDDEDAAVNPTVRDVCDGIDNDCDNNVDNEPEYTFFLDTDGDGIGAADEYYDVYPACSQPEGYVAVFGDCDNVDATIFPGAVETCDGIDNDCDGDVDEGRPYYPDNDGDGFGSSDATLIACSTPSGHVEAHGDCNDSASSVYPGATDTSGDSIDQDCGGADGAQPSVGLNASTFSTIQAAIDAASSGSTVWIGPGNHHELELHFGGKALALRSTHGPEDTVIDARQLGRLLRFEGDGPQVVVAGFTLTGGLEALGGAISMTAASPTLEHLMVWGNRASMSGGAIYLEQGSAPSIRKTSFYSNVSVDQIYNPFVSGGALSGLDSSPTILQSAFYGNAAIGFESYGGAMDLGGGASTITATRFARNFGFGYGYGGAALFYEGTATLTDCTFEENYSDNSGGAITALTMTLEISGSQFLNNTAEGFGGALDLLTSGGTIRDSLFSGNLTNYTGGGAVSSYGSSTAFDNCSMVGNYTAGSGGAVLLIGSSLTFTNSRIDGNTAEDQGGGIAMYLSSAPTLHNSVIQGNTAGLDGGAMYLGSSSPAIDHCVITRNASTSGVSGLYLIYPETRPHITNSILAYNANYNLYLNTDYLLGLPEATVAYSDLYNAPQTPNHNVLGLATTNKLIEPGFLAYDADGLPIDHHLFSRSPLIDQGNPEAFDLDGTVSDIGSYGGTQGGSFDLDLDGLPDYFWPGELEDAPEGFNSSDYDCDDLDPGVQSCL